MTIFRSEDMFVGLLVLGLVPWIGWTLIRGLRDERLPIGRAYVGRDERPTAYYVLLGFWVAVALMSAMISLDLLFKIDLRFWL
jgi:hypothetical protein